MDLRHPKTWIRPVTYLFDPRRVRPYNFTTLLFLKRLVHFSVEENRMKRYAWLLGVLALCLSVTTGAYAQDTRGSIEGVVKDASGAVLPGATVEAKSPSLVGVQSTTSDANGLYRFPALSPGIYEVSATLSGFTTKKVSDIQLSLGQTLKVDFALPIAGMTESVQVTAESPLIDVKANAAAVSIQADIIDRIP